MSKDQTFCEGWNYLFSLELLVNAKALLRAGMHKMPLLLFPEMLGTQGHALLQGTGILKFYSLMKTFGYEQNPKGFPGQMTRPQHHAMFTQGPLPEPYWCLKHWDIFSPHLLCRNVSCFVWCKMFAFLLPLFFRISLVRGSVFLPQVAIPRSYASKFRGNETAQLPSQHLCEGHVLQ